MPAFLQITDTHIVPEGVLAYGRSDTAAALERAVDTVNARLPLLGQVDCAIVTGDLTDHGTAEEYARFRSIMDRLAIPYLAVPGNHDLRDPMRAAFADQAWMPRNGPIQWCRNIGPFTVIALDTLLEGSHFGHLSDDGFTFLDRSLRAIGTRPAIVATHHPWMKTGIDAMDADNLRNGAALMTRLQAHPGPVRMISGHVHRAITGQIGAITCQIGPATCHAVHLDHSIGGVNALTLEPGAVSVFSYAEDTDPVLVSDILPTGDFPGPWPFFP